MNVKKNIAVDLEEKNIVLEFVKLLNCVEESLRHRRLSDRERQIIFSRNSPEKKGQKENITLGATTNNSINLKSCVSVITSAASS